MKTVFDFFTGFVETGVKVNLLAQSICLMQSDLSEVARSNSAPVVETIPRQAVTAPAALVASPAADHTQVGSSDVL